MTGASSPDALDSDQTPPNGTIYRDEWRLGGRAPIGTKSFSRTKAWLVTLSVVAGLIAVYIVNLVNPE